MSGYVTNFKPNQKVSVTTATAEEGTIGPISVTTLQYTSTPGILATVPLHSNTSYLISITGKISKGDGKVKLYIATPTSVGKREIFQKIFFSNESLTKTESTLTWKFENKDIPNIRIGLLFSNSEKGDTFILKSMQIEELKDDPSLFLIKDREPSTDDDIILNYFYKRSPRPWLKIPYSAQTRPKGDLWTDCRTICLIAMWGRHDVVLLNIYFLLRQTLTPNIVIVVSNPEDETFVKGLQQERVKTIMVPNRPLGKKWQDGVDFCRQFNPEVLIINGSDDFLSQNYVETCYELIKKNSFDLVGCMEWFIYDYQHLYLATYTVTKKSYFLGAGRAYSRSILNKLDWQVYNKKADRALDRRGYLEVLHHKGKMHQLNKSGKYPVTTVLSVKGNWEMINPLQKIKSSSQFVTLKQLMNKEVHVFFPLFFNCTPALLTRKKEHLLPLTE